MLEKEFHIAKLISKQLQENLHPEEQAELDAWLQASSINRAWLEDFYNTQELPEKLDALRSPNEIAGWNKIIDRLQLIPPTTGKIKKLWAINYKLVAAAMLLFTLSAGAWFYFIRTHTSSSYANDIAPGKNSATLMLANGRKISLSGAVKGQLATEAGVSISKTKDGQLVYSITDAAVKGDKSSMNTLSTSRGEQYQVILPDSTKVWLNAASSIKYPASFAGLSQRTIVLSGEAYFEVAKDKHHPFIVKTSRQQVEVLGTHFNVNSYEEESSTTTTLLEGSVKIASQARKDGAQTSSSSLRDAQRLRGTKQTNLSEARTIKPGEQAVSNQGQITVEPANIESALDWHRGDFVFNDDDFRATMRKIARWYDVDVIFDPSAPEVLLPGGWISRSKNLAAVLTIMELTGKVHFKVEGRRVTVTK